MAIYTYSLSVISWGSDMLLIPDLTLVHCLFFEKLGAYVGSCAPVRDEDILYFIVARKVGSSLGCDYRVLRCWAGSRALINVSAISVTVVGQAQ